MMADYYVKVSLAPFYKTAPVPGHVSVDWTELIFFNHTIPASRSYWSSDIFTREAGFYYHSTYLLDDDGDRVARNQYMIAASITDYKTQEEYESDATLKQEIDAVFGPLGAAITIPGTEYNLTKSTYEFVWTKFTASTLEFTENLDYVDFNFVAKTGIPWTGDPHRALGGDDHVVLPSETNAALIQYADETPTKFSYSGTFTGGPGDDVIDGRLVESADLVLIGGNDIDFLYGGAGNDTLVAGDATSFFLTDAPDNAENELNGGPGDDTLVSITGQSDFQDVLFGGTGKDTYWIDGKDLVKKLELGEAIYITPETSLDRAFIHSSNQGTRITFFDDEVSRFVAEVNIENEIHPSAFKIGFGNFANGKATEILYTVELSYGVQELFQNFADYLNNIGRLLKPSFDAGVAFTVGKVATKASKFATESLKVKLAQATLDATDDLVPTIGVQAAAEVGDGLVGKWFSNLVTGNSITATDIATVALTAVSPVAGAGATVIVGRLFIETWFEYWNQKLDSEIDEMWERSPDTREVIRPKGGLDVQDGTVEFSDINYSYVTSATGLSEVTYDPNKINILQSSMDIDQPVAGFQKIVITGDASNLVGNELDNTLVGNERDNSLSGGLGNDTLNGRGGDDELFGGPGDDMSTLNGGEGDDFLDGGEGVDVAEYEGASVDFTIASNGDGSTSITDNNVSDGLDEGTDTLVNVEFARFLGDQTTIDLDPNAPTGSVTIDDLVPSKGTTLYASNTLADADGLGTITYQWQRDGADISGATGASLTLTEADVGHVIRVVASYIDGGGTFESVASDPTAPVTSGADPGPEPDILGTPGNDAFAANSGRSFTGNGGHDIVVFSGASADYTITHNGNGSFTVTDSVGGRDGSDSLSAIEVLDFTDKLIFITDADGADIARLYKAALGRPPDTGGLFGWQDIYADNIPASAKAQGVYVALAQTNNGYGTSIAGGFTQSVEFQQKYGQLDDIGFVRQLYENVLERAPEPVGLFGWLDLMQIGGFTREMVLVGFAQSTENIQKTASDWLIEI